MLINVVTGGDPVELAGDGIFQEHDTRYEVTDEFLHIWRRLAYAPRAARVDAVLVLVTAFAAIFISVDESILIGVGLSILMFVPRTSRVGMRELIVTPEGVVRERQGDDARGDGLLIYDLEGELFFGAAPELGHHLETLTREAFHTDAKAIVLRLRRARNPDVVAIEHLEHFLRATQKHGIVVLPAGVRADLTRILHNLHFEEWLPAEHVFPEEDQKYSATLRAGRHPNQPRRPAVEPSRAEKDAAYYPVS